jgi:hypothetical protein
MGRKVDEFKIDHVNIFYLFYVLLLGFNFFELIPNGTWFLKLNIKKKEPFFNIHCKIILTVKTYGLNLLVAP